MDEKRPVVPEEAERHKTPEDWGSMTGFWKTFVLTAAVILSGLCFAMVFGGISGGILLLEALAVVAAVICWMRNMARRQRAIEEKLNRLLEAREDKLSEPAEEP